MTEHVTFFAGTYGEHTRRHGGGGNADEGEHIDVVELPREDATRMIETGEICDAKTVLLIDRLNATIDATIDAAVDTIDTCRSPA